MTLRWHNWPKKKYDLIVVDPPWSIKMIRKKVRPNQVDMPYSCIPISKIKLLPISRIAEDNCVLFLWTIQKYLRDAFSVLDAWGFKHLLTLTWNKTNGQALFGFNWQSEFVLVSRVGSKALPMYPRRPTVRSSFTVKSTGHSVKPDEFYEMIKPFGEKRIDLFARQPRDGYDVWGDEV